MKNLLTLVLLTAAAAGQTLSPAAREYVKVDSPAIVLTRVRVIDGTGARTRPGRHSLNPT